MEASLSASGAPNADAIIERLGPRLDRWTAAWSDARRDACLARPDTPTEADHGSALSYREHVLAILEAALGSEHPDVATARSSVASAYAAVGRIDEALALFRRALADLEAALGSDHLDLSLPLVGMAGVELHRGELQAAREHVTRGLEVLQPPENDLLTAGQAHFIQAQIIHASGGDREQALALARRASDELAQAGAEATPYRENVEAWIASPE